MLSCGGLKYEDISYIAASGHSGVINHPTSNLVEDIWGIDPNLVWCCIPLSATPWEEITKKQHDLLPPASHTEARFARWMNLCDKYIKNKESIYERKKETYKPSQRE